MLSKYNYLKLLALTLVMNQSAFGGEELKRELAARIRADLAKAESKYQSVRARQAEAYQFIINKKDPVSAEVLESLRKADEYLEKGRLKQEKSRKEAMKILARLEPMEAVASPVVSATAAAASTTPATPVATCAECHDPVSRVLKCGACKSVVYCGAICQRSAWLTHKKECTASNLNNLNYQKK